MHPPHAPFYEAPQRPEWVNTVLIISSLILTILAMRDFAVCIDYKVITFLSAAHCLRLPLIASECRSLPPIAAHYHRLLRMYRVEGNHWRRLAHHDCLHDCR